MHYTADVVHPKAKSASAVQWAHSSLSRILMLTAATAASWTSGCWKRIFMMVL